MGEEKFKQVKITKIIRETHDARSFVLQATVGEIPAVSGQFLTFIFNSYSGAEIRRSYSLSSSPETGEELTVTIKRIPNGEISRKFIEYLKEGDTIRTIGASGFFTLPNDVSQYHTLLFFAAGSGITPVYSLIKTALRKHNVNVVLVYSNRNVADTIFHDELKALQETYGQKFIIHFLYSLSHDLSKSRLTPVLLENLMEAFSGIKNQCLYYVCGPAGYMRMIQFTLLSIGVPAGNIKREIFHVLPQKVIARPPDITPHQVTLIGDKQEYEFEVQYPVSILQAAKALNIPVSFSCEAGQCGTCVATCLHGEVWMSRNEILLEEELAQGRILTCTGFPVNGNVIIKI